MKLLGVPFIPLYKSELFPMLKPLVGLWGKKNRLEGDKLMKNFIGVQLVFWVSVFIGTVGILMHTFANNKLGSSIGILIVMLSCTLGFLSIVSFLCSHQTMRECVRALSNIIEVYRFEHQPHILFLDSFPEVEKSIRELLVHIAEQALRYYEIEPQGQLTVAIDQRFKRLHAAAETLGFKLGEFKPFYDQARAQLAQAKALLEAQKKKTNATAAPAGVEFLGIEPPVGKS